MSGAASRLVVAPLAILLAIAAMTIVVPVLSPHAIDHVYGDFVRVRPSFAAHPTDDEARDTLQRLARRQRADLIAFARTNDGITARLRSARAIDERRLLALFERSGSFGTGEIVERADGGREIAVNLAIFPVHFLLGTDGNGRDLLVRIAAAGRVSLAIGALAALVALVIGVAYGAVAGFAGGRTDALMMRFVDILYAMPYIFFVILLVAFFGRSLALIFVAVGAVEWLDMARIVRGETLSLKQREFVTAARALGVSDIRIISRHIVPNAGGQILAYASLLVPRVILLESFLSFLGLGVQEPNTSWGVLIADGARSIDVTPYLLIFPSLALCLTLLTFNWLGEALRRAFDPARRAAAPADLPADLSVHG